MTAVGAPFHVVHKTTGEALAASRAASSLGSSGTPRGAFITACWFAAAVHAYVASGIWDRLRDFSVAGYLDEDVLGRVLYGFMHIRRLLGRPAACGGPAASPSSSASEFRLKPP